MSNYEEGPAGDDYVSTPSNKNEPIAVQSDDAPIDDPIDSKTADSDEQLARDDKEAIDKSNIIKGGRTRGTGPKDGYQEPGDEEGLPGPEDGSSSVS